MKVYEVLEKRREENYEYLVRDKNNVSLREICDYFQKQKGYLAELKSNEIMILFEGNLEDIAFLRFEETLSPDFKRIKVRDCGLGISLIERLLFSLEKF